MPIYRDNVPVEVIRTLGLFTVTAIAEIIGCYLPYLWLKHQYSPWLIAPAAASLAVFVWLLTLHPQASGRVYAAYGSVYICVALFWLWRIDGVRPVWSDFLGVTVCLIGAGIIVFGPRATA